MLAPDRDSHDHLLRAQFLEALPGRVAALLQGAAGLRARPDSETNHRALVRRLEALHEAALALDLDGVARALGEALIALEGPTVDADDLDLLDDALSTLSAATPPPPRLLLDLDDAPPTPPEAAAPRLELAFDEAEHTLPGPAPGPGLDDGVPGASATEPALEASGAGQPELALDSEFPAPTSGPASRPLGRRGASLADEAVLDGRQILLVDDDPAVLRRFGGILRSAGANVETVAEGVLAWQRCLSAAPELVLCDVLMPELDGFALCRNLKGDVVLGDVPVILLSWKEDLLQRARELGARADAGLAKHCEDAELLARCAEALGPRARLEERFASDDLVHGRLDGVTPRFILELVSRAGRTGIVEFCDAGFAYEAHFVDGRLIHALRRGEHDVQRGNGVLKGLLGVRAGRFILRQGRPGAAEFDEPLARLLEPHVRQIRAACHIVRGKDLHRVTKLELDESVIGPYRAASPTVARKLVDALATGLAPSRLTASVSAGLLEQILVDLALRGAIVAAPDAAGHNLIDESCDGPLDADVALPPASPERPAASDVVFSDRLSVRREWDGVALGGPDSVPPESSADRGSPVANEAPANGTAKTLQTLARSTEDGARDVGDAPRLGPASRTQEAPPDAAELDLAEAILAELAPTPATPRARLSARLAKSRATMPSARGGERVGNDRQRVDEAPAARARPSVERTPEADARPSVESARAEDAARAVERPEARSTELDDARPAAPEGPSTGSPRTMVLAMSRMLRGLEGLRHGASRLLQRSATWAPPEFESELSPLPASVEVRRKSPATDTVVEALREGEAEDMKTPHDDLPARERPSAAPPASEAAPEPAGDGGRQSEAPAAVRIAEPSHTPAEPSHTPAEPRRPVAELDEMEGVADDDPTDPDWVPPVTERPLRERFLVPTARGARRLGRAALPMVLLSTGGLLAYFGVHTLSSVVPGEAARTTPEPAAPPAAVARAASPAPVDTTSGRTAAQELLERGGVATKEAASELETERGTTRDLDSQITALPSGITLAGDKGLLEINSGDKHKIYVAGVFVGRGPLRRIPLSPGTHQVEMRLGAEERTHSVVVEAGKRTRLEPVARTAGR